MKPRKLTRTMLNRRGYKKSKNKTEWGNDFYFKRRTIRGGSSRCSIQVEFVCDGVFHVNANEKDLRLKSTELDGYHESRWLCSLSDLVAWEKFAFCQ